MDSDLLTNRYNALRTAIKPAPTAATTPAPAQTPYTGELFPLVTNTVNYGNIAKDLIGRGLLDPTKIVKGYGDDTEGYYSPYQLTTTVPEQFLVGQEHLGLFPNTEDITSLLKQYETATKERRHVFEGGLAGALERKRLIRELSATPELKSLGLSFEDAMSLAGQSGADLANVYALPTADGTQTIYDYLPTSDPNISRVNSAWTLYDIYKDKKGNSGDYSGVDLNPTNYAFSDPLMFYDPFSDNWSQVGSFVDYISPVEDRKQGTYWVDDQLGGQSQDSLQWLMPEEGRIGYYTAATDLKENPIVFAPQHQGRPSWIKKTVGQVAPVLSAASVFMPALAPFAAAANIANGAMNNNPGMIAAGMLGAPIPGGGTVGGTMLGNASGALSNATGLSAGVSNALVSGGFGGALSELGGGGFMQGAIASGVGPATSAFLGSANLGLTPQQIKLASAMMPGIYKYSQNKDPAKLLSRLPALVKAMAPET